MNDIDLRQQLLRTAIASQEEGLNRGTSGNLSVRCGAGFLITPSGMPISEMQIEDLVYMDMQGNPQGRCKPSSEWRFHRDILHGRPEANAVLHAHSTFATTLACLGLDIPPFHYMIAAAGGKTIRCAPYAIFGSQALSDHAMAALEDRKACLLANHGMIAIGTSLESALALAIEVECLCQQYSLTLQTGAPNILTDMEMDEVIEKFKYYGRQNSGNAS